MRWTRRTGAFPSSCSTSIPTPARREPPARMPRNRKRRNRPRPEKRNPHPRVRSDAEQKKRLATKASPENCFVMRLIYVVLLYLNYVHLATTRRIADDWEDTAAWDPMEPELSGPQHMQMHLPYLPTAVTPLTNVSCLLSP